MWALYTFTTIGVIGYIMRKIYRIFYPLVMKSFDDVYEEDEYTLLCYRIKFEDGTDINKLELTNEEVADIDEDNKIKYIIIEYMFNGKFMKYITYDKDITFPVESNASNIDEIIEELKITKVSERSGRAMDHEREDIFENLRTKGYM